ncbi:MAG TPA: DUF2207 domain-containing protein, partial [Thermoanaerobaculia bacterium]|nr:DUF2207 domain-containing protein [Thermoanaerobaculia bacterium]
MRSLLFVVIAAFVSLPLQAKSLYWRAIDVDARLDAEGRLHVVERQTFVFDGDWNGGERTFNVHSGQSLQFDSVSRVVDGKEKPLIRGSLINVDHWDMFEGTKVRWRSREVTDPEFSNTEITYVLRYRLLGVLRTSGDTYRLDHDFAFPDRSGVIKEFSLRFVLDREWKGLRSPYVMTRQNLQPGHNAIVTVDLEFTGATPPTEVVRTMRPWVAWGILVLFVLGILFLLGEFFRGEWERHRFAPLPALDTIDEPWLKEHILEALPEVAGAAIRDKVEAPSVAAVLARMEREGKISTRVEQSKILRRNVLHLKLEAPRSSLPGYELSLVKKLFFKDRDETDTDSIRKHYKSTGFSPAATIESGVRSQLARLPDWNKQPERVKWKKAWRLPTATGVLLLVAAFFGDTNTGIAIFFLFFGLIPLVPALVAAHSAASSLSPVRVLAPLLFLVLPAWIVIGYARHGSEMTIHPITLVAISMWTLTALKITLDLMRIRETAAKIDARKRFAAARRWFARELRSPQPRLKDEWFPYVIAF